MVNKGAKLELPDCHIETTSNDTMAGHESVIAPIHKTPEVSQALEGFMNRSKGIRLLATAR